MWLRLSESEGEEKFKELQNYLSKLHDIREWQRLQVVRLRLLGKKYQEIQKVLDVSISFIAKTQRKYKEKGIPGLKLGYQGSKKYLNEAQLKEINEWLIPP